ncbi:uncharacterized protein MKK02DRAFT_38786 [Dioszegia hungarica]|uniref:Uncharacterized protein n=1 Tax=Dioszegia hungarica TaxID=4972 RepID=A0AA38H566_9TREE|nr:uncharacterized protein MKK02DRAFT_38786 [Dioszegia hungarica]KAI9634115.1 hypothetical protein MKK02DRAFT_38786 [Dioszegia hungarica]
MSDPESPPAPRRTGPSRFGEHLQTQTYPKPKPPSPVQNLRDDSLNDGLDDPSADGASSGRPPKTKSGKARVPAYRVEKRPARTGPIYPKKPPEEPPEKPKVPPREAGDRFTNRKSRRTTRRDRQMSTWRSIWSINGFLTPWLYGWIKRFFKSEALRWLGRQTPWMLILLELLMAALIGSGGLQLIPDTGVFEGMEWYTEKDGMRLGGWGYCDASGTCVVKPFYNVYIEEPPDIWHSTIILSGLILAVCFGGLLLLLCAIWALLIRIFSTRGSLEVLTCASCAPCILSAMEKAQENSLDKEIALEQEAKEKGKQREEERDAKDFWMIVMEWTMWAFSLWVIAAFTGLEIWSNATGANGLVGDAIMKYLLGLAFTWLVVRSLYRSYWALGIEKVEEVKPEA